MSHAPVLLRRQEGVTTAGTGTLLALTAHLDTSTSTVQLDGELDLAGVPVVCAALDELLTHKHRCVCLDLSRLTFIDCAGLGTLVHAHQRFETARGALTLTGVGPRVADLLRITGLDNYLLITDALGEPRLDGHLRPLPEAPVT